VLTPADYNELWDWALNVETPPRHRYLLISLLVERANLQEQLSASPRPLLDVICPCGDSGKPGHPLRGYCSKGIGGV